MTLRDGSSEIPLPSMAPKIASALREAGDEGLTIGELEVAVGTRWLRRVIRAMCKAGYNIGEDSDGHLVLVIEPPECSPVAELPRPDPPAQPKLFEPRTWYSEAA